jgi:hypothetical protein
LAKSLARVDFPAAILPHKKINFVEVFMRANDPPSKSLHYGAKRSWR